MIYINGYKINFTPDLVIFEITKKQTRKFNNKRWVKKYHKNHTKVVNNPKEFLLSIMNLKKS
jgi:hypothetical protein